MLAVVPFFLLVSSLAKAAPFSVAPRDTGSIISTCNQGFAFTWSGGPNGYEGALSYYSNEYGLAHVTYFLNAQATFQGVSHCIFDADMVLSLQRAYQEASQIASSGWSNADLTTLTYDEIDVEIGRMNDAISKILGVTPNFYRPPTLTAMNDDVAQYLQQKYGMTVVTWSDDSNDLSTSSVSDLFTWYTQLSTTRPHISLAHSTSQASITLTAGDNAVGFWSLMMPHHPLLTVASCLNMTPYTTTTGQFGTMDDTWTCDGTWSPPASSSTTTAATTATAFTFTSTSTSTTSTTTTTTDSKSTTTTTDSSSTTTTDSAPTTSPTGPTTLDSYNGWDSAGCYVDSVDARCLPVIMATDGGAAALTVELCLDACHAAGYVYGGLEWSQECYCGNSMPTEEAIDGRCDMVCNGNPLEYCGGSGGLNVYKYTDASVPTTKQSYSDWNYSNCYVDSVANRVLPETMPVTGAMTVELCLDTCNATGYEFAGLEWSQECYCGRSLPTEVATDGRCNMVCRGDSTEFCGGSGGIDVYSYTGTQSAPQNVQLYNGWTPVDCYVDSAANRVFPDIGTVTEAMTVELCIDACSSAGFSYAGVEWGQECYCGRSLPTEVATDGRCNMVCQGNSLEYCGGSGGINIYQAANAASGPSVLQSYNGWSTEGCYVDSVADRSMPYAVNTVDAASMTVEKCLDACSGLGYTYAGLEYAQECYCGSALPAEEATDGRCSMVCNGNSLEYCGGGNGMNVYSTSS